MRVNPEEFRQLPLEVHDVLRDVPLIDVSAVDLPGGEDGRRTLKDVRELLPGNGFADRRGAAGALFALRSWLGRVFGWDDPSHNAEQWSYLPRVSQDLRARSEIPSGTTGEEGFRVLYSLEHESLGELRNATVHGFLCMALRQHPGGFRLYWAIYVKPVSWLTPAYMALIEPFRRFIVYPTLLGRLRSAWSARYSAQ